MSIETLKSRVNCCLIVSDDLKTLCYALFPYLNSDSCFAPVDSHLICKILNPDCTKRTFIELLMVR